MVQTPLYSTVISEKSMLENSLIDDFPPLETVPELCEIPSFLGTDIGDKVS